MSHWPKTLVREIAERRVVFFVGAGITKAAYDSFPRWPDLLDELSKPLQKRKDKELVKRLVKSGSLLDAAQIIRDSLPKADFNAEIRRIFQIRPIPNHEVYKDILLMDPKTIVTTNYDELLEKNFEHYSGGSEAHSINKNSSQHILNDLRSPIRSIIKIHGCVSDPADIVLDRSSYFNVRRNNPSIFHAVSSLMTVNTVLFVGYSISDPDIQLILENINILNAADHCHYALMSKFEHIAIRSAKTSSYNVGFVEYPANQHDLVPGFIANLREQVLDFRSARGII